MAFDLNHQAAFVGLPVRLVLDLSNIRVLDPLNSVGQPVVNLK